MAEDIAGHSISVLVDFFHVSLIVSFPCFVHWRVVVFAYDVNFKFASILYCESCMKTHRDSL